MIEIVSAQSYEQIEQARTLFREYQTSILIYLSGHNSKGEVPNLPGNDAAPDGLLLLAFSNEKPAGCIALRKLEVGICEMKRLFVREEFRGQKIGVSLIEKLIGETQEIGYEKIRLDTYPPKMGK